MLGLQSLPTRGVKVQAWELLNDFPGLQPLFYTTGGEEAT